MHQRREWFLWRTWVTDFYEGHDSCMYAHPWCIPVLQQYIQGQDLFVYGTWLRCGAWLIYMYAHPHICVATMYTRGMSVLQQCISVAAMYTGTWYLCLQQCTWGTRLCCLNAYVCCSNVYRDMISVLQQCIQETCLCCLNIYVCCSNVYRDMISVLQQCIQETCLCCTNIYVCCSNVYRDMISVLQQCTRGTWFSSMWDATHSCVRASLVHILEKKILCRTWLIFMCAYSWCVPVLEQYIWGTWTLSVRDMTHSCEWASLVCIVVNLKNVCGTWLI